MRTRTKLLQLPLVVLSIMFISASTMNAQTYNNPGGTINTCSGSFFDTGGSGGDYGNSQNITTTFCSNAGNCVSLNFSAFNLESGWDYMYIYDGPNTGSPMIGTYTGTTSPGVVTSTTGCITINFTSDGSVVRPGWAATISCGVCPPPSTNYNNPGGTITTCSGTFFDTGGAGSNYTNGQNITTTFCSGSSDCLEFTFTSFNTESGFDELNIYDGPNTGSALIGTHSGMAPRWRSLHQILQ